jgi:DNA-binding CsgD family transcriptional regulator
MTWFELGKAYFYFNEYERAATFFKKVDKPPVAAEPEEATGYKPSLLYMAIIMQKWNKADSSYHYLQQLKSYSAELNDTTWLGIASGYLGYNHLSQGQYEMAEPLIQKGIDIALEAKDTGWAIRQKLWLADLYFKQNNPQQGIPLVQWSRDYFSKNNSQSAGELTQLLYPLLAKQYAAMGQGDIAGLYLDSSIIINDKLNIDFSGLLLARAQQKTNLEVEKNILEEENAKSKERNIVLVFLFVLLLFVLYIHKLQQKKFTQKKQLNEALLRQQERELLMATDQLKLFSKRIANKNKLLDVLHNQYGELSTDLLPEFLQNNNIITSQDWDNFKILFEKVHSGYLHNLRQKLPELSPVEMRYMALAKLNFSNKEMAFSMGVSPESIRVTLHRLRKKLNLPEDTTIEDLVASI